MRGKAATSNLPGRESEIDYQRQYSTGIRPGLFSNTDSMSNRMENANLVLKFKLTGDADYRIRAAARIKVDDQGGLTMYDAGGRQSEKST